MTNTVPAKSLHPSLIAVRSEILSDIVMSGAVSPRMREAIANNMNDYLRALPVSDEYAYNSKSFVLAFSRIAETSTREETLLDAMYALVRGAVGLPERELTTVGPPRYMTSDFPGR